MSNKQNTTANNERFQDPEATAFFLERGPAFEIQVAHHVSEMEAQQRTAAQAVSEAAKNAPVVSLEQYRQQPVVDEQLVKTNQETSPAPTPEREATSYEDEQARLKREAEAKIAEVYPEAA